MSKANLPESSCSRNTDRELWRETEGDYYAHSVFVTEGGGIGMNAGGTTFVMTVADWVKRAEAFLVDGATTAETTSQLVNRGREAAAFLENDQVDAPNGARSAE